VLPDRFNAVLTDVVTRGELLAIELPVKARVTWARTPGWFRTSGDRTLCMLSSPRRAGSANS
jgi:hypothetical protein